MASLIENRRRILLNSPHPERLTGGLLTFRTDMAVKLPEVMVQVLPVQDLHGYGAAYPPGGWKNIVPDGTDTSNGYLNNYYITGETGVVGADSASIVTEYFPISAGTTYTMSTKGGSTTYNAAGVCFYDSQKNFISGVKFARTTPVVFTTPSGAVYARCTNGKQDGNKVQIERGYTATSYSTFSNICPITGVEGIDLSRAGLNIFNFADSRFCTYPFKKGMTIYVKQNTNITFSLYAQTADQIVASTSDTLISMSRNSRYTITLQKDYARIVVSSSAYSEITSGYVQISFEPFTTMTPFNAATIIPVSWQSDAGTVYKALLDLLTGEFLVTHAIADLGALEWERNAEYGFFATVDPLTGAKLGEQGIVSDIYCSHYEKGLISTDKRINVDVSGRACISDSDYSDASTFEASLSGVQLVYELASPVKYQLTGNQLSALKGVNNIWSTNGNVSVKYWTH